ncbi:hypothetical protein NUW54_g13119 [Trametes sanguinea]|uniref:Uncharacterized protein n=1 Tax=Trametes sanguinea TaxID=158606 RepID=A0ACC1MQ14_9APHY|nr:hypothetical protein NUW54_g13119 [Trametes sanguinea]
MATWIGIIASSVRQPASFSSSLLAVSLHDRRSSPGARNAGSIQLVEFSTVLMDTGALSWVLKLARGPAAPGPVFPNSANVTWSVLRGRKARVSVSVDRDGAPRGGRPLRDWRDLLRVAASASAKRRVQVDQVVRCEYESRR